MIATLDRTGAADDFGHLVSRKPMDVVHPASAGELAAAIRSSAADGLGFAARGCGHSTYGRSQVADGIVAEMSGLCEIGPVGSDRIAVGAGLSWSDVLDATLPHGLTPPVLTDYLDLSVGGTLVVGGVGGTTSTYGVLADTVLELEVVTGTGEVVTCSAAAHRELFDAVRAGLGQVGVITRATVRLVRAPELVRRVLLTYRELGPMLRDARRISGFDVVQGAVVPAPDGFVHRLDLAAFGDALLPAGLADDPALRENATLPYREYLERLAPLEAALRSSGQWWKPHPWLTTFVGDAVVEPVVERELAQLDPAADLGPLGQVVLSPIRTAAVSSPLFRLPADELCFTFNLLRLPMGGDAERLVDATAAAYRRIRAAGGTLYPVSAFPLSADGWREHFGPAFAALAAAKRRYDPAGILTPGYEVFA